MPNEHPGDELRQLWQSQTVEERKMPLDEIRRKAGAFEKAILRRNAWEYAAGIVVVLFFGWHAWAAGETGVRVGSGLIVAGMLYVAYQLYRRGSAQTLPTDSALTTCLDFHRKELERQRDLLRGVWSWHLLPLVPGLIVFLGGAFHATPGGLWRGGPFAGFCAVLLFCVALFFVVGKLNQNAARALEREIDALDASAGRPTSRL